MIHFTWLENVPGFSVLQYFSIPCFSETCTKTRLQHIHKCSYSTEAVAGINIIISDEVVNGSIIVSVDPVIAMV